MARHRWMWIGAGIGLILIGMGRVFFVRAYGSEAKIARVVQEVSQLQRARVRMVWRPGEPVAHMERSPVSEARVEGVFDVSNSAVPVADLKIEISPRLTQANLWVVWSVRMVDGVTWIRLDDAPAEVQSSLQMGGVERGVWQQGEGPEAVWKLMGSSLSWPGFSPEQIEQGREVVRNAMVFLRPQATLTEILHGRVTRLWTSECNVAGVKVFLHAWSGVRLGRAPTSEEEARVEAQAQECQSARMNLWIDPVDESLHRIVVQWTTGALFDLEISEQNKPVRVNEPSSENLPTAREDVREWSERVALENEMVRDEVVLSTPGFPVVGDYDRDGLSDDLETFYGSHVNVWDTDGDGFSDGEEVDHGYNPTGPGRLFDFGLAR